MLRKTIISLLTAILTCGSVSGDIKDIGTPFIRNFSKKDYRGGTQNWSIAQDLKGFMYFANNDGLLVYDGTGWEIIRMPNLSMVRSLYIDTQGKIYIGAYNELGQMVYADNGKLTYRSFKEMIPEEHRIFDDVWNIFSYRNNIVFQSYYAAYFFDGSGRISVVAAPSRFQSAHSVNGRLIFNDVELGLVEYRDGRLVELTDCSALRGQDIWSIMPYVKEGGLLITTLGQGLFIHDGLKLRKWTIPVNEILIRDQVFSATLLHQKYYAIGTILNGVIIIDQDGNVVQHINKKKGLQNNTVLDLFADRAGNLWLALDNGIDYLAISSPVTFLKSAEGFAGYASVIHDGKIYLGTNQGLFVRKWPASKPDDEFRLIPGTYGQVWYLGVHNGLLLCGHNNGTYLVSGERAELISKIAGGWKYHELRSHPGYLIGGTYGGITLFRWEQGKWKFVRQIKGCNESFRVFEEDDQGEIWMSHGFKGIFRIRLNNELDSVVSERFYNSLNGLPSDYYLSVFKVKGKIIITSETEIYEYSPADDRFVRSVYFNQLLSPLTSVSYLHEDDHGNIWYVARNRAGVFKINEDFTYQHITSPFILLSGRFIHGFESIYPYSPENVIFGTEDGFAHYSPDASSGGYQEFSAYVTRCEAPYLDSVFYYGKGAVTGAGAADRAGYSFPYKGNSFIFRYTSPVYDNAGNTEYSYMLAGFDKGWSQWSSTSVKEYSNLPDGRYIFQVKARNQLGIESLPDFLEFTVLHPWYKSAAAWIAYVVLGLSLALVAVWLINKRIEETNMKERESNQRLFEEKEEEYRRQALEAEKEIIRIKNERLQAEMIQRDKELANEAMNLVRKNEFLTALKDELNALKANCPDESISSKVMGIITRINREVDSNRQREVFETAFDQVNEDFMNRLKTKYPALTPTELRLCAYLKMNISTKEIAPLMNISVRGVEICRYRVRKKMGLSRNANLAGTLINF